LCLRPGGEGRLGADHARLEIDAGFGNDVIRAIGGSGTGSAPADSIRILGDTGVDNLLGGPGPDWIDGGTGNDTVEGGAGADTLLGDTQTDVVRANDGEADARIDGGNHTDTAYFDAALETPANAEVLLAS
jgi:Ca2+-binding RTX toxin-like protein